jgi:Flp pilus assembly protein CpaB
MQSILDRKLATSRGGSIALGVTAALLAALLLVVYLNRYRSSVKADAKSTPVLVAKSLIPKGTPGSVIAQKGLYSTEALAHSAVKTGAVVDPAFLAGRVAVADIYPGQQITDADVSVGTTNALPAQITGRQRAFALPVTGAKGLVGYVNDGDHVDVYYETAASGTTGLALLAGNVVVLRSPTKDNPVILKADAALAQKLALATDTGSLWFLLRPSSQAQDAPKKFLTSQQLLDLIKAQG